jgi:hypothetical protein
MGEWEEQFVVEMIRYLLFGIIFHIFILRRYGGESRTGVAVTCTRNSKITRINSRAAA